jgi:hypothetical protein
MSKYNYPSRYYADDKDVWDLLSEQRFNSRRLLRFARSRGIFLSPELSKDELVDYLSQLPFSFDDLMAFMRQIETEEKEEDLTSERIVTAATVDELQNALKHLQETRGTPHSEVYQITPTAEGVIVCVRYRELDHRSSRVLQWTDHTVEMQARKIATGFEVRYTETDRGRDIMVVLTDKLAGGEKKETRVDTINLSGVGDSVKRTEFFRLLIYGLDGLRVENVKDARMNRVVKDAQGKAKVETTDLSVNGEEEEEEPAEPPTAMLKRTTLTGDSVFQTKEFQEFCARGFFASRVVWTAVEKEGKARKFEFESEFKDAENCRRFAYRLRGSWERDEDGDLSLRKSNIGSADHQMLAGKLEVAAYTAMAQVSEPPAKKVEKTEANTQDTKV